MDSSLQLTPRLLWGAASAIALIVGSVGAWITVGPFSVSGTSGGGDGTLTLVAGAVGLVCVVAHSFKPPFAIGAIAVGFLALAVSIYDTATVGDNGNDLLPASVGWGLILCLAAAASLFAWGLVAQLRGSSAPHLQQEA